MFTGQVTGAMPSANKVIVAINTCKCHCQTSKSFIINICSCDKISRFLTEKSHFLAVTMLLHFLVMHRFGWSLSFTACYIGHKALHALVAVIFKAAYVLI